MSVKSKIPTQIDPNREQPLTFTEAAKLPTLRRNGKAPAVSTLWRWATNGVRGHLLEIVRIGGTACTTAEAVNRLLARLNERPDMAVPPHQRNRQVEQAEKILDAAGVRSA